MATDKEPHLTTGDRMHRWNIIFLSACIFGSIVVLWASNFGVRCSPGVRWPMTMTPDSTLNQRLIALAPTIDELMKIAGTAGVSLGVLHHGRIVHHANFGFRDVGSKLSPDEETVFPICSFTKAILSAAIGVLVDEGALTWDTRVRDILPDFKTQDEILNNLTTITDLLAHRTGMSTSNYWLGSQNNILIAKEDSLAFMNNQKAVNPFRGQWQYNNLGFDIAGLMIEKISGKRWDEVVKSKILVPLGLHRTFATAKEQDDNSAKAYGVLENRTPIQIDGVKAGADTFGGANGGIRSCVKDLLKLYQKLMQAADDQFNTEQTSTPESPFKQVSHLLSAKIPLKTTSLHENSYGFGWVRSQTPNPMGAVGLNPDLMPGGMPIVGKGSPSRLIIYHQGSLPGSLAAVNLLPESQSAVVVLTNTLALNDCADWIGQLILEELMGDQEKNDFIEVAKSSISQALSWHSTLEDELKKHQTPDTSPRSLDEYIGTYINNVKTVKVEVTRKDSQLYWALQGLESEKYSLAHYQDDVFTWLQPRDELAKRGRFTHQGSSYYKIRFGATKGDSINQLSWTHDADVPEGETFHKLT